VNHGSGTSPIKSIRLWGSCCELAGAARSGGRLMTTLEYTQLERNCLSPSWSKSTSELSARTYSSSFQRSLFGPRAHREEIVNRSGLVTAVKVWLAFNTPGFLMPHRVHRETAARSTTFNSFCCDLGLFLRPVSYDEKWGSNSHTFRSTVCP
jgi:hypothetical protein